MQRENYMLIIWDFDGVICDSDDIWAENWRKLLKSEKDIEISEQEKRELLIGISEKDKAKRLESHFSGLKIDDAFKKKLNELHDFGMKNLLVLTNGVDKIFADSRFKQCIATGGNQYQNDTKNHTVGIDKYFSKNNCFTADMVEKGKPNPDIFLLAAEKMQVFAFCGAKANNNPEYKHKCLLVGADKVFDNMEHLHTELVKLQN